MHKILVIEDNREIRENICELLELDGYQVIEAENGKIGLQLAFEMLPDLVLCDIMMPLMDGYKVLEQLKLQPFTTSIPFIFLTANVEKKEVLAGLALGAKSYISKPFETDKLLQEIRRWL
ncbi:response regulator [Aurantibacillus circumpalustris]|uniref:response regulator n=1 Tax=Aurantibacillus circumpalustris TaxID=3036359 RepID=UPI00295C278F|nr:response regulator [Aurantibacillus circumpalustris]